jgi:hypothetical protein
MSEEAVVTYMVAVITEAKLTKRMDKPKIPVEEGMLIVKVLPLVQ